MLCNHVVTFGLPRIKNGLVPRAISLPELPDRLDCPLGVGSHNEAVRTLKAAERNPPHVAAGA